MAGLIYLYVKKVYLFIYFLIEDKIQGNRVMCDEDFPSLICEILSHDVHDEVEKQHENIVILKPIFKEFENMKSLNFTNNNGRILQAFYSFSNNV